MPARSLDFDYLDYQIIQALHIDARQSASEIARAIGVNERTIRKRIDRQVQQGVIRLVAIVDPDQFGYKTAADIFLEVDPDLEESVIHGSKSMPEGTYLAFGQGTNDISMKRVLRTIINCGNLFVAHWQTCPVS